jgi:hypothetical protein
MRKVLAAGAVALATLALCASALAAVLPTFRSDLIVPNRSVAGITLMSHRTLALQKLRSGAGNCRSMKSCTYTAANGASFSMEFIGQSIGSPRVVASITIQAGHRMSGSTEVPVLTTPLTALKTSGGIGLGSTLAVVRRAYPHATGNARIGLTIKSHDFYTKFGFLDGKVTLIEMGAITVV